MRRVLGKLILADLEIIAGLVELVLLGFAAIGAGRRSLLWVCVAVGFRCCEENKRERITIERIAIERG